MKSSKNSRSGSKSKSRSSSFKSKGKQPKRKASSRKANRKRTKSKNKKKTSAKLNNFKNGPLAHGTKLSEPTKVGVLQEPLSYEEIMLSNKIKNGTATWQEKAHYKMLVRDRASKSSAFPRGVDGRPLRDGYMSKILGIN